MINKALRGLGILVLVGVVALLLAGAIVPRAMGAVPLTVLTGSMVPALQPGDLAVVSPIADPSSIRVGEIISFRPESGSDLLVTHRVLAVSVLGDGKVQLVTKGDASPSADEPIKGEQAVGRMEYKVPFAGYMSNRLSGEARGFVTQGLGVILIGSGIIVAIRSRLTRKRGIGKIKGRRRA